MSEFKVGDVVVLGPRMAIDNIGVAADGGPDIAVCTWFVGSKLHTRTFLVDELVKPGEAEATGT